MTRISNMWVISVLKSAGSLFCQYIHVFYTSNTVVNAVVYIKSCIYSIIQSDLVFALQLREETWLWIETQ